MRTIGMIGGMSWQSTAEYYRLANELVARHRGGLHSARCVVYSVDFAEIERQQVAGEWHAAGEILAGAARALEAAGADLLLICTNTMHKVADQVQAAVSVPLLHLIDVTAEAISTAGLSRVGLLATRFTMEEPFYRERLAGHGIEAIVPPPAQRAAVHRVIYDELCRGVMRQESRQELREVIGTLVDAGAEAVVLGCTELELLIDPDDAAVPVLATTQLHITAAVAKALELPVGSPT